MQIGSRLLSMAAKRIQEPIIRMWRPQLPVIEAVVSCKFHSLLSEQAAAALEIARVEGTFTTRHLGALMGLPDSAAAQLIKKLAFAGLLDLGEHQHTYRGESQPRETAGELAILFDGITGAVCVAGLQGGLNRRPHRLPGCVELSQRTQPDTSMLRDILGSTSTARRLYGIPENITSIAKQLASHSLLYADTVLVQTASSSKHLLANDCSYFFDPAHPLVASPKTFQIDDDLRRAQNLMEEEVSELGLADAEIRQTADGPLLVGAESLAGQLGTDTIWLPNSGLTARISC